MTLELKALRLSSSSSPSPASEERQRLVGLCTYPFLTINDNRRKVDEEKEGNSVSCYNRGENRRITDNFYWLTNRNLKFELNTDKTQTLYSQEKNKDYANTQSL
jgi:hypothetical protein